MNFALGSSFNINDIIDQFPTNKLSITCEDTENVIGDRHRKELVRKIFTDNVKMILDDVIENGNTFILPTGAKSAEIRMIKFEGDNFKNAKRNGKFNDIDILSSYFTGYQLGLFMNSNGHQRVKPIYVNKKFKDKIITKTNAGFSYA